MADGVIVTNLNLTPGHCVEVTGFIPPDCKRFIINLGEDESNYLLHFNPRFDYGRDFQRIICNDKEAGRYGVEEKQDFFPFQQGTETTVCFEFRGDKIMIKLPSGEEFSFKTRKVLSLIPYLSLQYIKFKSIKFK